MQLDAEAFTSGVLGELRHELDHVERNRGDLERSLGCFDAETLETRQTFERKEG